MKRSDAMEILDQPGLEGPELAASLREVWGVNRLLGGMAVLTRHLRPYLGRQRLRVLDVAGGAGDVACGLLRWADRLGVRMEMALLDCHPQVLALARERARHEPRLTVVAGDARALPFGAGEFDLAVCNLALHHFGSDDAAQVLRELDRVGRRGWIVADLQRHPAAYAAARLLAVLLWRSPITRHDGPLSVLRAYSPNELQEIADQACVSARVYRHALFQQALVCRRG